MFKRIAALVGVVLLCLMYITALVAAVIGSEFAGKILAVALVCTIIVPVMIHLLLMMKNAREGRSVMDETYQYKNKR